MDIYRVEDVIKHAIRVFKETIAMKVEQLRAFVPRAKDETNTDLTGAYIESLVRSFVQGWIGTRRMLHGTLYSAASETGGQKPLQIDGIVYDPRMGPPVLMEGDFGIIHPVFCAGVIEIKMTTSSIISLEERLQLIHARHMHHTTKNRLMGIVIADKDPEKVSSTKEGAKPEKYYEYSEADWCPIFVLFKETDVGYEPHDPAISAMIRSIFRNIKDLPNYL